MTNHTFILNYRSSIGQLPVSILEFFLLFEWMQNPKSNWDTWDKVAFDKIKGGNMEPYLEVIGIAPDLE